MSDAPNPAGEGPGLPGFDRLRRATKGGDLPPVVAFTPAAPPPQTSSKRSRFSAGRVLALVIGLVVFFFVLNVFLFAVRGF